MIRLVSCVRHPGCVLSRIRAVFRVSVRLFVCVCVCVPRVGRAPPWICAVIMCTFVSSLSAVCVCGWYLCFGLKGRRSVGRPHVFTFLRRERAARSPVGRLNRNQNDAWGAGNFLRALWAPCKAPQSVFSYAFIQRLIFSLSESIRQYTFGRLARRPKGAQEIPYWEDCAISFNIDQNCGALF